MTTLYRYSDPFDNFFKGFFVRPTANEAAQPAQRLKVEVSEDDKQYKVLADIPGVKKEDINVSIDGDQVSIAAELKQEKESKENGGRVIHTERYYGKVSRSFRLGQEVDRANVQARYDNGVLELSLPKRATESAKQITIQ